MIELSLPCDLFKCNTSAPINLVADNSSVPNVHCKLADKITLVNVDENDVNQRHAAAVTNDDTHHNAHATHHKSIPHYMINVEFYAYGEKMLREELKLINVNNSVELLKLVITARVLGKGKGTPMLRNGIHCIGFEPDDESEMSEDQCATVRTINNIAGGASSTSSSTAAPQK